MQILEFIGFVVVFLALTQVILPLFLPKWFDYFWLFKLNKKTENKKQEEEKDPNLSEIVDETVKLKKTTEKTIQKVRKQTKENLNKAKELDGKLS